MFTSFLKKHSFEEYDFGGKIYHDVSDREYWDNFAIPDVVKTAESYLDYGWPVIKATDFMEFKKSGNRAIMEKIHFERRSAVMHLVFGELCENKGRFIPQIVNALFTLCEETYWGLSAHWFGEPQNIPPVEDPYIDLFAAETAEHLASACYLLRGPLLDFCPEILTRVEYELEKRIKNQYLIHEDYSWMGRERRPNNWNPWILSNVLTVFLLTEKDKSVLYRALNKMFCEIQYYYDGLPDDGGCDEGADYWSRAGASLYEFVYLLKISTCGKLNLFDDVKLRLIGEYMKKVHIRDSYFVCFADCVPTSKRNLGQFIYGYGRETGAEALMSLGVEVLYDGKRDNKDVVTRIVHGIRRHVFIYDLEMEMRNYKRCGVSHGALELLESLNVATLREGEWVLCAKGGHNRESHNHNDVGSFALYYGEDTVLCDVGIGTYTRQTFSDRRYEIPWTRSLTHNVPEINGAEQRFGREFAADYFSAREGGVSVSFAKAYPKEAKISSLKREISLAESGLTFTDSFEFSGNESLVSETLMTTLDVKIDGNSVILGGKYRITATCGVPKTEFFSFEGDKKLTTPWKCDGATRITFTFENCESVNVSITKI